MKAEGVIIWIMNNRLIIISQKPKVQFLLTKLYFRFLFMLYKSYSIDLRELSALYIVVTVEPPLM